MHPRTPDRPRVVGGILLADRDRDPGLRSGIDPGGRSLTSLMLTGLMLAGQ